MIQVGSRIENVPRYHLVDTPEKLLIVPDEVRKCVCFVGLRMADGTERFGGTAFYVSRDRFGYLVTARHVIEKIEQCGLDSVLLRINWRDADVETFDVPLRDWMFHPSDRSVDVAVLPFVFTDRLDLKAFPLKGVGTHEFLRSKNFGVGENVFLTGLFVHHKGNRRNIPLVRCGNVAAMPEEKVQTKMGRLMPIS